jgi:hypothetical protein
MLVVGLMLSVSQAALASPPGLQSGVHVDPGSPAGKEYQFPVVGARGETAGGAQGQGGNPPLFGVGVTPAVADATPAAHATETSTSRATGAGVAGSKSTRARRAHTHPKPQTVVSSSPAADPTPAVDPPVAGGSAGGSGWIALVAGGLLVLVLGGGGGFLLRQRVLRS